MLNVLSKSFFEEILGQGKLIDDRSDWEHLVACAVRLDLVCEDRFQASDRLPTDLFLEDDGNSQGEHRETSPQVLSVVHAIARQLDDSCDDAADFGHDILNSVHAVQSFRRLA